MSTRLPQAGLVVDHQHVRKQHRERLVADDMARRPDGMAKAARLLLAHEGDRADVGRRVGQRIGDRVLAVAAQRHVDLEGVVEMILDRRLHAAGDDDDMLDAGRERLADDVVEHRTIDDGQKLLGNALGGRQHAGAETGSGNDGLADSGRSVVHGKSPEMAGRSIRPLMPSTANCSIAMHQFPAAVQENCLRLRRRDATKWL